MVKESQCGALEKSGDGGFLLCFVLRILATHRWWSISRWEWLIPRKSTKGVDWYVCCWLGVEISLLFWSCVVYERYFWAWIFSGVIVYRLLDFGFVLLGLLLDPKSSWQSPQRLVLLAIINYIEVIISFAVLCRISSLTIPNAFNRPLAGWLDAIYYSSVTATTLGYGDFFPEHFLTKACAIGELLLVVLVVVSAIGPFVSLLKQD
jgi:hypothetical protein